MMDPTYPSYNWGQNLTGMKHQAAISPCTIPSNSSAGLKPLSHRHARKRSQGSEPRGQACAKPKTQRVMSCYMN